MPDPIWTDTCTLVLICDGDFALETELQSLRAAGHELLIVPAVRHELMQGNPLTASPKRPVWEQVPSDAERERRARVLNRLGVKVDMATNDVTMKSRVRRAFQDHLPQHTEAEIARAGKDRFGNDRIHRGVSKYIDGVSQSDSAVLAQIKISAEARGIAHPVIFTAEEGEKAMVTKTHLFGVTSITRKTRKPPPRPKPPKPPRGGGGGAGGNSPKLNLSEYPADKEIPVVRFFKDRAVLQRVGFNFASNAVELFQLELSDYIASHCGKVGAEVCAAMNGTFRDIPTPLLRACPTRAISWKSITTTLSQKPTKSSLRSFPMCQACRAISALKHAVLPIMQRRASFRSRPEH